MYRLWSDGRIECGVVTDPKCDNVSATWTEIPNEPPFPPDVRIVQITANSVLDVYRLWSDGTIERNTGFDNPCSTWCGWTVVP